MLFVVSVSEVDKIAERNVHILRGYHSVLKEKLVNSLEHIWEDMNEKPELRYRRFWEERKDLLSRIKQKDLASYLGITLVSLSRLKKRIEEED